MCVFVPVCLKISPDPHSFNVSFVLQGMITIVLECIDRLNVYNTAAHFSEFAGEEAAESWKEIVNLLYELLGD